MNPFLNSLRGFLKMFSIGFVITVAIAFFGSVIFLILALRGLPDVSKLQSFHHTRTTEVYSDDGVKIGEFTAERRYPVDFPKVPRHVKLAFVAAEDSNFYEHGGIDLSGIVRAVFSNLLKGRFAQGGSTITQQVARGILLETRKKEITRKIREMVLAWQMEQRLKKDEILKLYLDEIYLGHGAFGIGAAAKNYFNKSVEQLNVAEAAMLAGLPQRPTEWDPFRTPHQTKTRQQYVLKRMVEEKVITEEERKQAASDTLTLYKLEDLNPKAAPYFTEYVRIYLMDRFGADAILKNGYRVRTSVRYDYQKAAEEVLELGLRESDKRMGWRGVVQHLDSPDAVKTFASNYNDLVLDRVIQRRLFPPLIDSSLRKLPYDLSQLQRHSYLGVTPVREGSIEKAIVSSFSNSGALLQIGLSRAELPLAGAEWVRINDKNLKSLAQILREGDVIEVKVEKVDRKLGTIIVSLDQEPEIQGALLSFDLNSGKVLAMVGGTDFQKSQFNRALYAKRQVGSTVKPFIYAAALEKGFSPASPVSDSPIVFRASVGIQEDMKIEEAEDWRPHNYTERFEGYITLRQAIIRSLNIPTIKILNEVGVDYGIQFVRSFGITAVLPRELTIALGSWSSSLEELMSGYAMFPRLGEGIKLKYLTHIQDNTGYEIPNTVPKAERDVTEEKQIEPEKLVSSIPEPVQLSPQTAYVMTDLLKAVVREGTGGRAAVAAKVIAGKTGTSNDHRDAWFIGYSQDIITGIWVGYDRDKALEPGESGGRVAAPIFAEYMSRVLKDYPSEDFEIPDGIVFAQIDRNTGRLAGATTDRRVKVAFREGTLPDSQGGNLLRIREPGVKASDPLPSPSQQPPPFEDDGGLIRRDYEE